MNAEEFGYRVRQRLRECGYPPTRMQLTNDGLRVTWQTQHGGASGHVSEAVILSGGSLTPEMVADGWVRWLEKYQEQGWTSRPINH